MTQKILAALGVAIAFAPASFAQDSTYDTWGSWSPDGQSLIGYSYSFGDAELIRIDVNTGEWTQLTDNEAHDWFPQQTTDGRFIVYVSDRGFEPFGGSEIYVRELESGEDRQLTHDGAVKLGISLSPDGSRIVFPAPGAGGETDVWMIDIEGTNLVNLTQSTGLREVTPSFTRDGEAVLFSAGQPGEDVVAGPAPLMRLDLETGETRTVLDLGSRIVGAREASDGRIYFTHNNAQDNRNVARFDPERGEVVMLTRHDASDHGVFPSPDGNRLSFATYRWGDSEIYLMNPDGSDKHNLTRTSAATD